MFFLNQKSLHLVVPLRISSMHRFASKILWDPVRPGVNDVQRYKVALRNMFIKITWNIFQNHSFPQTSAIFKKFRNTPAGFLESGQTLRINFCNNIFSKTRKSFTNFLHVESQNFNCNFLDLNWPLDHFQTLSICNI